MTPAGRDLLDEAARLLREDLAPRLAGEDRYRALLAANAVATAAREAAAAARLAAAEAASPDPAAIRAGRHDDDREAHARLLAAAALRAWIADPAAPTDAERAAHLEGLA